MTDLKAQIRLEVGKKTKALRQKGIIPAVLYGPAIKKNLDLQVSVRDFEQALKTAGQTSFVTLNLEEKGKAKNFLVLIHDFQRNSLDSSFTHVDFYQPSLTKEIKVKVPLVFTGESQAVKSLGGTLVKNIQEVEVKALPEKLPHEIKVDISSLDEIGQSILVKDLVIPEGVKLNKEADEIVVQVQAVEKIEEELAKPVEEKVEEVKVVEKEKKEEEPAVPEK